jgi:hypothetical protein
MIMKNILKFLFISFLLTGCDDDNITFRPYNSVSEAIVLKTEDDFKFMLNGAYSYMIKNGGASGYGQEFLVDSEVITDNVIPMALGRGTNVKGYRWQYGSNDTHFDYYDNAYRSAEFATRVIRDIDLLPASTTRDDIEGQARFLRALNNFDMVRIYSKIPTQSTDAGTSLGMYYLETVTPSPLPRLETVNATYQKILDDLLIAKDKIAAFGSTNLTNGTASKTAVYALLSRVYLYMGDYPKVIEYGNLATNNASAPVCPRANLANIWKDTSTSGLIFQLRIDIVDGVTPGVAYSQTTGGIKSEYVVPKNFYDLYQTSDIRKTAFMQQSNFAGNAYNHILKYYARPTGNRGIVNIKVLRMEEVYLNMAEAQYRIDGGGLDYLDKIRSQRYSPFVSGSETGDALWSAIMLERRLELAFEMDRFFTLKRLALPVVRPADIGDYANGGGEVPVASALLLPAGDFKWQLPIPQYQIDVNANLQQNPGY